MGFVDLLVVALVPVCEVLLVTAIGLFLATDAVNVLGPNARHYLNNLVFYVFSPALVVSQLGETITFSSLVSLWFMPVNILVTFIIGSVLAWILIKITRTPPKLQGLVIGCCSAGNLGNLLLIIVPAVCEQSNSPFGDSTICSTYGKAYASLSMAVGAVYIWTYVYFMMRIYAEKSGSVEAINNTTTNDGTEININTQPLLSSRDNILSYDDHSISTSEVIRFYNPKYVDQFFDSCNQDDILSSFSQASFMKRACTRIKNLTANVDFKMVFAPSTIAAIIGFTIGSVSPIRKSMIGTSAPLHVLDSSASLLGDATIPSMTLIVGANLLKGLKGSGVSIWVIIGIIAIRYALMPAMGIGIVKAAYSLGMVGSDSLYQFVLLLQYALPPAMTVGVIAQLFEKGESECSVIMLWTYVVAGFSLTIWSTFYMWLLQ